MIRKSQEELRPHNGHTLIVGVGCRISGCQNQKELSLEDQADNARDLMESLYDGPVEFRVIPAIGKGERLDRPELAAIEAAYRSGEFDVFVFDDLSRLIRGGFAAELLGIGVDNKVRSICISDGIDTCDETWEEDALSACSENVAHNQRTSMRIKQKTMNRFKKFGATARRPIYGYQVPEEARSYDDWQKDPAAEVHILRGAEILREELNGEAVARYFQENSVPVGPYARNPEWDGKMVLRLYRNPLLKGMPQRGRLTTVKEHATGKRRSQKNPQGPTYYPAPHLAYFSEMEFDDLTTRLMEANANYRRRFVNGVDPRAGVPRKQTRFPGQHARCWYCGRTYNWGGNGILNHMMCSGSHRYQCWNSIHIDGDIVVQRIQSLITESLYQLDGFDNQFREIVEAAAQGCDQEFSSLLRQIELEEAQVAREEFNVKTSLKEFGPKPMILDVLNEIEARKRELKRRRYQLERAVQTPLILPKSTAELRQQLEDQFLPLNRESAEFGALLRKLVPEFHVFLVQLIDGGHPLPRARIQLNLGGLLPEASRVAGLDAVLTGVVTIDLFDRPPQRERIRDEAVRLEAEGLEQRQIARAITEQPRQAAVFKALSLHRQMVAAGLSSPYRMLLEPPDDYSKLRRCRNVRYKFQPLEGYEPPNLK